MATRTATRTTAVILFFVGMGLILYGVAVTFPASLFAVAGIIMVIAADAIGRRLADSRRDTGTGSPGGTDDGTTGSPEGEGPTMEVRFRRPDER